MVWGSSYDGQLSAWIDSTGELGWCAVTASRGLVAAVAHTLNGTMSAGDDGQWCARIPRSVIPVVVLGVDTEALRCRIGTQHGGTRTGVFALRSAPWATDDLTACPLSDLPAAGRLAVRAVVLTTRMGRTIRYLAPTFTPAGSWHLTDPLANATPDPARDELREKASR